MTWSLHRWVWLLEAPLSVGVPPAGALNRCRPYVLSRGIWGALTSELAQAGAHGFPDYRERGRLLREGARFTYLYPAASVGGSWRAWLPEYLAGRGLVWRREDQQPTSPDTALPDRRFRRRLIEARPGTAIDPDCDTAAEATLRETECMMTRWRPGSPGERDRVALAGYVFLDDIPAAELDAATTLFVGGDTRYGLGRMRRIALAEADTVFGARAVLDGRNPRVIGRRLLAHGISGRQLQGAKEALTAWDRTAADPFTSLGVPRWAPGSRSLEEDVAWQIDPEGTWRDSP
jgi:hypothetical protein